MEIKIEHPFKLLVVDDNPNNIQVLGNILKEAGYVIGFATDGKQALNLLQKTDSYDLVLLDVDMPVMNGYEACRAIRADSKLMDLPVIFLTAFTDVENKITGFEAGAQDFVTKPYNSHELLSRVKTHVELKRSREKLKEVNKWLEIQVKEKTIELEKALYKLNKLDKLKTNFLYQISEEIKTPLNGIIGTINLVKNEDRSPAVKDMIDILEISLSRLENFVSKAVFSSQLGSSKFQIHISEFNPIELAKYVIIDLNSQLINKNLRIKLDEPIANLSIKADKDLIFKALNYLLENAIKFSLPGGEISISNKFENNIVQLFISDSGHGFSDLELNNLAFPFTSDTDMSENSNGISLIIVKQIMDLHNAKLTIENNLKAGARVGLIFNSSPK